MRLTQEPADELISVLRASDILRLIIFAVATCSMVARGEPATLKVLGRTPLTVEERSVFFDCRTLPDRDEPACQFEAVYQVTNPTGFPVEVVGEYGPDVTDLTYLVGNRDARATGPAAGIYPRFLFTVEPGRSVDLVVRGFRVVEQQKEFTICRF